MDDLIEIRTRPLGTPRAAIAGTDVYVFQVAQAARDGNQEGIATQLGIAPAQVAAALAWVQGHPEQIARDLEESARIQAMLARGRG